MMRCQILAVLGQSGIRTYVLTERAVK